MNIHHQVGRETTGVVARPLKSPVGDCVKRLDFEIISWTLSGTASQLLLHHAIFSYIKYSQFVITFLSFKTLAAESVMNRTLVIN